MSHALLDSLASGFDGDAGRRALLDAALRDGLPGPRSEAWKYTSLRALERRRFDQPPHAPAIDIDPALLSDIPAPRLVFVNGRFDDTYSDMHDLPAGVSLHVQDNADGSSEPTAGSDEVFARLNAALARTGARLTVEAGVHAETPVHLVFIGASADRDLAWHLRHRIELAVGARLSLVEHHLAAGEHRHLDNSVLELRLQAGVVLEHLRLQAGSDGATSFLRTDAQLLGAARYLRCDLELGAALSRHELDVRLDDRDAEVVANGVLLASGRRHLDTRLGIEHVARDTRCGLLWRGIGAGRARAVFHGGITIHAGADGSDAQLSNKNLLLSPTAEIDTQPVLVIHADEVQAAHGATVGQLDPNALFYLRSRGLPQAQAQQLLTAAFVREPLAALPSPALRALAEARLDAALRELDE
ncbi:Fe-S cluster assembly protein SufD [Pseudoxanthomonas kalamensis DSM 18571]|uniref:Fe-S cluster assembly protein SufD n=1 Tax=Pseudoxanthomonas kalamensis TaxID=289483 RepID=UPI001390872A|nr:Fe-S cluster assembly protein SufD [Pseudoxanthomonas kalamensis]KAF1711173.1 Fe-S cluster assembly protein SufD [Pseudoxanthomonas kalamensis DSM 18571]